MPRLDWLDRHMDHCDTLAQWLHQQFHYEFADLPLRDWQRTFAAGQRDGQWQCLIALDGEQLLGSAALAIDDLPQRPELGPWLACVFVAPQARGRGLAERLIEGVCAHARGAGIDKLFLHTHDQQAYYARRGWIALEQFQAWGKPHWLMSRELGAHQWQPLQFRRWLGIWGRCAPLSRRKAAPTGTAPTSGHAPHRWERVTHEASDTVPGTGYAGVRD